MNEQTIQLLLSALKKVYPYSKFGFTLSYLELKEGNTYQFTLRNKEVCQENLVFIQGNGATLNESMQNLVDSTILFLDEYCNKLNQELVKVTDKTISIINNISEARILLESPKETFLLEQQPEIK